MRRGFRGCALLGGLAWLALPLGLIEKLFLLAPLVALPLAFALAAAQIQALPRLKGRMSKLLLALSSAALGAGMLVAAVYELGCFTGRGWLSIPEVARAHGPLNGLGFALGGLNGLDPGEALDAPSWSIL